MSSETDKAARDFAQGAQDYVDRKPPKLGPVPAAYRAGQKAHAVHREIEIRRAVDRALGQRRG